MPKKRLFVVLLALWVAGTLVLATGLGSSVRTQQVLLPLLSDLGLDEVWALRAHKALRKLGHVVAYAGFGLLLCWALEGIRRRAVWVIGVAAGLAVLDETIQAFFASRGASGLDVLLDLSAVALVMYWAERRRRRTVGPTP